MLYQDDPLPLLDLLARVDQDLFPRGGRAGPGNLQYVLNNTYTTPLVCYDTAFYLNGQQ